MRKYLLLLSLVFLCTIAFPQEYLQLMEKENVNFFEVQKFAEKYFANKDKGRGSGYKHFKRWEYIHQKEIDDNGFIIKAKQVWDEQDLFLRNYYSSTQAHQKKGPNKSLTGNWTSLGPYDWQRTSGWNPGVGRIVCIDVDDSNPNLIYVGSPTGGLWKTTDGGANWQVLTDSFPVMDIWSVEIDPTNSNIVYMGTAGGGVLKTTDGGQTWNQTGSIGGTIRDILIHPTNNNIVFAARTNFISGAIYRSTNGGTSWSQVSSVNTEDLRFKPGNPNIVYGCGSDFQRSTDGGITWTTITSGITASARMKMDVSPANPNYIYIVQASGNIFGRVYRSTNSGVSFTIREEYDGSTNNYLGYSSNGTDNRGQASRDMAITVSNTNAEEIIIAGIILFKSTDGGDNYTPLTEWFLPNSLGYVHADVEVLDYVGNTLFIGSDGGIYNSNDNGSNFTDLTAGLGIRQFYRIGCSQTDPNVVSGGSQDNGTSVMRGPSRNWVDWLGADGMETFIDYNNANNLYGTSQYGSMYRSTNQGNSSTGISKPTGVGNGEWVTPFEIDPITPSTIYVGFDQLYKNTTSGTGGAAGWTSISSFSNGNMDEMALAPSDANTIYVSFSNQLFRTTDGGANWTNVSSSLSGLINYISVDPNDPQRVAVATSNGSRIYLSNNGGNSWANITANLPNIGANCVLLDGTAENGIYVGMQSGVYYKDDFLGTWIPFLTDLPRVRVLELEIVNSIGKIRAATYGRGLWESDTYSGNNGNLPPVANFVASATTGVIGQAITFTDASSGAPNTWAWSFPGGTPSTSSIQNPIVTYSARGTYDVSLSATNSNGSDSETKSSYITIIPYCIPDPATGTADGDYIDGVVLGTINNQNTGSITGPSYNDYTNLSTDIARNSNQSIAITSGSYSPDYFAAWIDYNQDNDFDDPGEKLGEFQSSAVFQTTNISFTVPLTAQLDSTTMRIRCVYNTPNMDPCTDYNWGETEDYTVVITSAVACSPTFTVGTSDGDFIDGVEFGNMSNTGTGSTTGPNFNDYGSLTCQVAKVDSHYLKITSGSYFTDYYAAWIDWNQNGDYTDPGEKIGEFQSSTAFETDSFLVPIPMSMNTGFYGMRIRASYNTPNMSPCAQYTWGETEDYQIEIIPSGDLCILPNTPLALNDSVCGSGAMTLGVQGTSNSKNWYTDLSNDTLITTGNTYTTSVLTSTETYYVAASNESTGNVKTTWFASDNGASGNLFDVFSAKNIRIEGFSVNLTGTTLREVAVYYKTGTFEGFETNSSAWTLLGVDTVMPAGFDLPTFVDVGGLVINQEQTYGILVHTAQGGIRYTDLNSTDTILYNNDISIRMGKGMGAIFNQVFNPRAFNGTVHYTKYAGCESSRVPVIAKVNPIPQVQISNTGPLCVSDNAVTLNANPSGGIFSGSASASGVFDPGANGVGFHDVLYNYTDMSGCSNADTITIEVKALPNVTLSSFAQICENDAAITLSGGSPIGGTYSGTGVSGGSFDPSVSGTGNFNITYTYTDGFGCENTDVQSITVNSKPNVSFAENTNYCEGDAAINLSGGSPAGGSYFGNGVIGSQFNPVSAGIGNHSISYEYQNVNGCSDTASLTFNVNAKPNVSHSNVPAVCEDATSFALIGASPSGGTYSGIGVSGNNFNPQVSGVGSFNLVYSYTDNNSCTDTTQLTVVVNPLPIVNLSGIPNLCESDNPINLSGGTPLGGIYSGTGVTNGVLNPSVAGSGSVIITYTYTDGTGCSNSSIQSVTITPKPTVSFNSNTEFCEGDSPVLLSGGTPSGGIYLGNGVGGSTFSPVAAGLGSHIIEYAYQDVSGCSDTASLTFNVNPKPVLSHNTIPDVCVDANAFALSGGTPAGGTYSGSGVSANSFDPQTTGVGIHPIYYAFTNSNGCSDSMLLTVQVNALPSVNLLNFSDICENEPAITLSGGNPTGGTYSGTGVSSGQFDPSITGVGTFNISYDYTDLNGCSNSVAKSINVIAAPQASVTVTQTVCENEGAISLNGGTPTGGIYLGTGVSGTSFDPALAGTGSHTISYIVSNSNLCSDTATANIQVNPAPIVSHSAVQDFCLNDSASTLTGGTPVGGTYAGIGISGNQFDPQVAGIGSHPISYYFTNANGCSDTVVFGVNVINAPTVVLNSTSDMCENASAQLLSGVPVGGTFSGTGVSGTSFDPSISGTGTFIITYTFTNGSGCMGMDTDTLTVNSNPIVSLDTFLAVCENDIPFALSGGLPSGGLYSGNGVTNGNFDPSIAGAGIHQITYTFTDANTCAGQDMKDIEVKSNPESAYGYVISAQTANFSDSSVNAADWLWNFDDGNTSTDQNSVHTYASGGNYNVCLTVNNNGCSDEYCELLTIITSLNSSLGHDNFQFYPNPFESTLNYNIDIEKAGLYRIDLMDIRSVNLKTFELNLETGENNGTLNLNGLPSGTYILSIKNNDTQKTIKVEKLK